MPTQTPESECDVLIRRLAPCEMSNVYREKMVCFIEEALRRAGLVGVHLQGSGSNTSRTYLPLSDIDLVIPEVGGGDLQCLLSVFQALCGEVAAAEQRLSDTLDPHALQQQQPFCIRNLEFINARTKVLHLLINNIGVDITVNQPAAVQAAAYIDRCDALLGCEHLLKRSLLLIKCWCLHESERLGARACIIDSKRGFLSSYAVCAMVLHLFNTHARLDHPLTVLRAFLFVFSEKINWATDCVSVTGVERIEAGGLRKGAQGRNMFASLVLPPAAAAAAGVGSCPSSSGNGGSNGNRFVLRSLNIRDPLCPDNNLGFCVARKNVGVIEAALRAGHAVMDGCVGGEGIRALLEGGFGGRGSGRGGPGHNGHYTHALPTPPPGSWPFLRCALPQTSCEYMQASSVRLDLLYHPMQAPNSACPIDGLGAGGRVDLACDRCGGGGHGGEAPAECADESGGGSGGEGHESLGGATGSQGHSRDSADSRGSGISDYSERRDDESKEEDGEERPEQQPKESAVAAVGAVDPHSSRTTPATSTSSTPEKEEAREEQPEVASAAREREGEGQGPWKTDTLEASSQTDEPPSLSLPEPAPLVTAQAPAITRSVGCGNSPLPPSPSASPPPPDLPQRRKKAAKEGARDQVPALLAATTPSAAPSAASSSNSSNSSSDGDGNGSSGKGKSCNAILASMTGRIALMFSIAVAVTVYPSRSELLQFLRPLPPQQPLSPPPPEESPHTGAVSPPVWLLPNQTIVLSPINLSLLLPIPSHLPASDWVGGVPRFRYEWRWEWEFEPVEAAVAAAGVVKATNVSSSSSNGSSSGSGGETSVSFLVSTGSPYLSLSYREDQPDSSRSVCPPSALAATGQDAAMCKDASVFRALPSHTGTYSAFRRLYRVPHPTGEGGIAIASSSSSGGSSASSEALESLAASFSSVIMAAPPRRRTTSKEGYFVKRPGDRLELMVSGSGLPRPSFAWFKNGFPLVRSEGDAPPHVLVIDKLEKRDEGTYTCSMQNIAGSAPGGEFTVIVLMKDV